MELKKVTNSRPTIDSPGIGYAKIKIIIMILRLLRKKLLKMSWHKNFKKQHLSATRGTHNRPE